MTKRKKERDLAVNPRQQQPRLVVAHHKQELRIAPLPKPQELADFDAVVPGSAERIIRMAEENGRDRRSTNSALRWAMILGQIFSFVLMMSGLWAGFYLVTTGLNIAGVAAILTALAAPVAALTYRAKRQQ